MNTPLLSAWITTIVGLVALRWLMLGGQSLGNAGDTLITAVIAAVFLASALLFSKGAARSPVMVRRITAWVMCALALLIGTSLLGFLILRALG